MGPTHPEEGGGAEFYRSFLILYPSFLPKEPPVLVEEGSFLPGEGLFHPEERSLLLLNGTLLLKEGTFLPQNGLFPSGRGPGENEQEKRRFEENPGALTEINGAGTAFRGAYLVSLKPRVFASLDPGLFSVAHFGAKIPFTLIHCSESGDRDSCAYRDRR